MQNVDFQIYRECWRSFFMFLAIHGHRVVLNFWTAPGEVYLWFIHQIDSGSSSDCSCSYSCMIGNFYFGTGLAIINWCFVAVNYAYVWNFIIILYQKAKKCMKFYYYTISKSQDAFQPYGAVSYFSFSILHFQVSILDEKIIAYNGNQILSS